jgi:Competence-damaged protein
MSSTVTADELDYVEIDRPLVELAINALASAERNELRVVTADCTGGLIATVLSEAPGAADYFDGAFVCYTADHECAALGVDPKLIERDGVVSRQVAIAMANGALIRTQISPWRSPAWQVPSATRTAIRSAWFTSPASGAAETASA